jgi:hypothetical protein
MCLPKKCKKPKTSTKHTISLHSSVHTRQLDSSGSVCCNSTGDVGGALDAELIEVLHRCVSKY